jgi:hypothetical protein
VDEKQKQRLAANEALFREVNERLRDVSRTFGRADEPLDFVCECSDSRCAERVTLTRAEYEDLRSDSARFVVAKNHAIPEIESVVAHADDHVIVEKRGSAADIAIHLDNAAS